MTTIGHIESHLTVTGIVTIITTDNVISGNNLITTAGKERIAQILTGSTIGTWYVMLGTGTNEVSVADSVLASASTSTWRPVTTVTNYGSELYFGLVYPAANANGSWTEIGLWTNATATVNSGTLVARSLVQWTKQSTQVATVNWAWTFS